MKKFLLVLLISFLSITLASCQKDSALTEDEVKEIIDGMLPEEKVRTTYDLASLQDALFDMLEARRDAIVGVVVKTPSGNSSGSGVIYKKEGNKYYVVTNQHVVNNYISISIVTKERDLEYDNTSVEYLGADYTTDLAVLTFESERELPVVEFADSYAVQVGEFVFAIGNPSSLQYFGSLTMGVVSSEMRFFTDGLEGGFDSALIQHDAAISQGSSGGALLNINGELLGINSIQVLHGEAGTINFAIPSNTVKRIVEDLEDDGYIAIPYVGLETAQDSLCLDQAGVCVSVVAGGGAEEAGLSGIVSIIGYKLNDAVDFKDVHTEDEYLEVVLNTSVGDTLTIKYIKEGTEYTSTTVVLDERP